MPPRRKPTRAAEREARSDANFLKGDRAARDAARRAHIAASVAGLRKSATISAQARARRYHLQLKMVDYAARRRERRKMIRQLVDEFDVAAAPLLAWFERIEG